MVQNLWDAAKAILRGKIITRQAYLKRERNVKKKKKKPNFTPTGARKRTINQT